MAFQLNNETMIQYVDNMFLHIHCSYGMTSIIMNRNKYDKFVAFIKDCLLQKEKITSNNEEATWTERSLKLEGITFISEGPFEDDSFNIFIDSKDSRTIIAINRNQIEEMLSSMESK